MPVVTRNGRRRARGARVASGGAGRGIVEPRPEQPQDLNQLFAAIQNLIGVVQESIPPVVLQGEQQGIGGQGADNRERSRSPPPRFAEDQGEALVHQLEPPPAPRDIGDEISGLLRLKPPSFTGTTDSTHAEAWL
jgi:hypothetical protein